jgi:hypothetical protein
MPLLQNDIFIFLEVYAILMLVSYIVGVYLAII